MTKCQKDPTWYIFMKRGMCKDIKSGIPICQKRKYKNTNTQIHKYTNTASDELLERPNMIYIYEKRNVEGYQKWYSHASKAQIQKYKYTKTQIHKYSKWWIARKTQHDMYLWKEDCARISKIVLPCVKSLPAAYTVFKLAVTKVHILQN